MHGSPIGGFTVNAMFWRPNKLCLFAEDRLKHRAALINTEPNTDGQHQWKEFEDLKPSLGTHLSLSNDIKANNTHGRAEKKRQIEQDHFPPAMMGSHQ